MEAGLYSIPFRLDYRRSLYCINRSIVLIAVEYFHRVDHDTLFAEQVLEGPIGLKDSTLYRSSVMMNLWEVVRIAWAIYLITHGLNKFENLIAENVMWDDGNAEL